MVYDDAVTVVCDRAATLGWDVGVAWGWDVGVAWGWDVDVPGECAVVVTEGDGSTLARNHLRGFVEAVVARFPQTQAAAPGAHLHWTLAGQEVRDWLLQQERPDHVSVYWSAQEWMVRADGAAQMLVQAQFLLDRRLVLERERHEYDNSTAPVVRGAVEEEWRVGARRWPAWHYVRCHPTRISLIPGVKSLSVHRPSGVGLEKV